MDWGMFLSNLVGNQTRGKSLYEQEQARLQGLSDDQADRDWQDYLRTRQRGQDVVADTNAAADDAWNNQVVGDFDPEADPLYRPLTVKRATQLGYKYVPKADRDAAQREADLADVTRQIKFWETTIQDPEVLARAPGYVKAVQRYASLTGTEAPVETVGRIPEIGAHQRVAGIVPPEKTKRVPLGSVLPGARPELQDTLVEVDPETGKPLAGSIKEDWLPKPAEPEKPPTTDQVMARILQKLANGEELNESEDRALRAWSGTRYPAPAEDQRTTSLRKELTDLRGDVDAAIKSGNAGLASQAVAAYNARLAEVQQYVPDAASGFRELDGKSIVQYIPNEAEATRALATQRTGGGATNREKPLTLKDALSLAQAAWKAYADDYNKRWFILPGKPARGVTPPEFMGQQEFVQSWLQDNAPQLLPRAAAQAPPPGPDMVSGGYPPPKPAGGGFKHDPKNPAATVQEAVRMATSANGANDINVAVDYLVQAHGKGSVKLAYTEFIKSKAMRQMLGSNWLKVARRFAERAGQKVPQ